MACVSSRPASGETSWWMLMPSRTSTGVMVPDAPDRPLSASSALVRSSTALGVFHVFERLRDKRSLSASRHSQVSDEPGLSGEGLKPDGLLADPDALS